MHPIIEEFCRIPGLEACQPSFFRRVQRELREQVQPLLDERDALAARVADLESELLRSASRAKAAQRGPA